MSNDEKTANNTAELRREAERKVASQLEGVKISSSDHNTKRLLHELQVHQVELEMQNDELRQVQIELSERETRFRKIVEDTSAGYFRIDRAGYFQHVNNAWLHLHGYSSPDEIIGKHFSRTLLDDDIAKMNQFLANLHGGNSIPDSEFSRRRNDGSVGYNTLSIHSVVQAGEFTGMEGFIVDTTDCKIANDKLRESEALYHSLVETSQDIVFQCDVEGRFTFLNLAVEQVFGYELNEMLGMKLSDFQTAEVAERDLVEFNRMMQGESIDHYETTSIGKHGNEIVLVIKATFLCDKNGNIVGTTGTAIDITERKRMEKSLRESEFRYHSLFENMLDGFAFCRMLFDDHGRPTDFVYLEVNSAFGELTGLEDVTGKKVTEAIPGIKESNPELFEIYGRVALTGQTEKFEIEVEPLGKQFSISVYSPKKEYFVVVFDDITEQKRAENVTRTRLRMVTAATDLSLDETLQMTLDEIEAQTGSVIGFYHFLEADQETLSLQTWSSNTLGNMCTTESKGSHYPVSQAGVWVDCVHERRPVIHNDYAALPHKKGMPAGHARVDREMVVPIVRNDRVVAIIGVGNKPTEYNATDIEIVSLFGDFSWEIVKRKQVEEELRDSENRYSTIFNNQHVIMLLIDPKTGEILNANPAACSFYGYSSEQFADLKICDLNILPRQDVFEQMDQALNKESPLFEFQHRLANGEIRDVEVYSGPIEIKKRMFLYSIIHDISGRKRTEKTLAEKRQELEEFNHTLEVRVEQAVDEMRRKDEMLIMQGRQAAMGEMINNIAHQWRQPLNILGLMVQVLPLSYDSEEFSKEFLEVNADKCMELIGHMSQTIDDFKNFFKADKEAVAFSVNQVIEDTLSLIESTFKAETVSIDYHKEENHILTGYPNEYSQVLLNILMNARDVLAERNVKDALILIRAFKEGDRSVVTITDNGGGIPDKIIDRLFDPSFTTKGPDKGTGIGLFMSKTIIEKNMGGLLTVRNTGSGAEFRIEV